ncbi:hypothetical protein WICPIJ_003217 [Wickerhamomyces pijperi]|uniref:Uncharacterized protein n=1 Tax=Wickerhamomyces pijperi TaxID=599730 RepID=A0A9P8TP28_WICPI|nr:hypothetical protein WICPIJ_003217 [Wickerhamomyces pijperi]
MSEPKPVPASTGGQSSTQQRRRRPSRKPQTNSESQQSQGQGQSQSQKQSRPNRRRTPQHANTEDSSSNPTSSTRRRNPTQRKKQPTSKSNINNQSTQPTKPPQHPQGPSRTSELATLHHKLQQLSKAQITHTNTSSLSKTFKILNKYKFTVPISKSKQLELSKFPDCQYSQFDQNVIRNFNWKVTLSNPHDPQNGYSVLWSVNYLISNAETLLQRDHREFKNLEDLNQRQISSSLNSGGDSVIAEVEIDQEREMTPTFEGQQDQEAGIVQTVLTINAEENPFGIVGFWPSSWTGSFSSSSSSSSPSSITSPIPSHAQPIKACITQPLSFPYNSPLSLTANKSFRSFHSNKSSVASAPSSTNLSDNCPFINCLIMILSSKVPVVRFQSESKRINLDAPIKFNPTPPDLADNKNANCFDVVDLLNFKTIESRSLDGVDPSRRAKV